MKQPAVCGTFRFEARVAFNIKKTWDKQSGRFGTKFYKRFDKTDLISDLKTAGFEDSIAGLLRIVLRNVEVGVDDG